MLQYSANAAEGAGEDNIKTEQLCDTKEEKKVMARNQRLLRAAMETPEQAATRRAKRIEYLRRKKDQRSTEELARAAERAKARRALRDATETPEQNAIRRSKAAERERKRRLRLAAERLQGGEEPLVEEERLKREMELTKRRENLRAEKPLNAEDKLKREMELRKRREKFRASKEKETPEQAAVRRAKANEREKRRREQAQTRKEVSPEKAAARRAKKAEYERKRRKEQSIRDSLNGVTRPKRKRKRETRKQAAERRSRIAEIQKKESEKQNATDEISTKVSAVKPVGIDEDINESCTWSSFEPSEGSFSVTTTEGSYSITTTEGRYSITTTDDLPSNQHEPEETILVKNEPFDGSLSHVEGSNLSFIIEEVFEDNTNFASIKDESVDLEYKPFTSHKGVDKNNIKTDKDISDAAVGPEYVVSDEINIETNVVIEPVLQDIIIKEEVDL